MNVGFYISTLSTKLIYIMRKLLYSDIWRESVNFGNKVKLVSMTFQWIMYRLILYSGYKRRVPEFYLCPAIFAFK